MTTTELAIMAAKSLVDPNEQICRNMWLPFALLYDELIKQGVPKLEDLEEAKKIEYWNKTKGVQGWSMRREQKRVLVCRALYVHQYKPADKELVELSVAWALGRISLGQVTKALNGKERNSPYSKLAQGLREYVKQNPPKK